MLCICVVNNLRRAIQNHLNCAGTVFQYEIQCAAYAEKNVTLLSVIMLHHRPIPVTLTSTHGVCGTQLSTRSLFRITWRPTIRSFGQPIPQRSLPSDPVHVCTPSHSPAVMACRKTGQSSRWKGAGLYFRTLEVKSVLLPPDLKSGRSSLPRLTPSFSFWLSASSFRLK